MTEREGFRFKMLVWRSGNKNGFNKKALTRAVTFVILILELRRLNFHSSYFRGLFSVNRSQKIGTLFIGFKNWFW